MLYLIREKLILIWGKNKKGTKSQSLLNDESEIKKNVVENNSNGSSHESNGYHDQNGSNGKVNGKKKNGVKKNN